MRGTVCSRTINRKLLGISHEYFLHNFMSFSKFICIMYNIKTGWMGVLFACGTVVQNFSDLKGKY